jgi:hypothetical protein
VLGTWDAKLSTGSPAFDGLASVVVGAPKVTFTETEAIFQSTVLGSNQEVRRFVTYRRNDDKTWSVCSENQDHCETVRFLDENTIQAPRFLNVQATLTRVKS